MDQTQLIIGTGLLLMTGFWLYGCERNKQRKSVEMLRAVRQRITSSSEDFPLVLYESNTWQGTPRPVRKDELVLLMTQSRNDDGTIKRIWRYNSFKVNPETGLQFSADFSKMIKKSDILIGFNIPNLNNYIFGNVNIHGPDGLDLNSPKFKSVKLYVKVR